MWSIWVDASRATVAAPYLDGPLHSARLFEECFRSQARPDTQAGPPLDRGPHTERVGSPGTGGAPRCSRFAGAQTRRHPGRPERRQSSQEDSRHGGGLRGRAQAVGHQPDSGAQVDPAQVLERHRPASGSQPHPSAHPAERGAGTAADRPASRGVLRMPLFRRATSRGGGQPGQAQPVPAVGRLGTSEKVTDRHRRTQRFDRTLGHVRVGF